VTYRPFGSVNTLQNGCVGSGCTTLQETYQYNNRLQPAMIELGTTSNPSADSCRVYNYYAGASNPASCAMPSQGSNNNGDVAGYYYNDNVNSGLNHVAAYGYDTLNRLISAVATGNVVYSQTYSYTGDGSSGQCGNLSCTPAGPGCLTFTYSAATNHITNPGYSYGPRGNLTGDGTNIYSWDPEAHLFSVVNGQQVTISAGTYNALGQRVRDVTPTSTTDEAYGADGELLWRYTGNSSDPNQRAFVPFGGSILAEYYSGGTIFDHPDELGSATTASDYTGNNFQERLYYPFGEFWTGANLANLGMHQTFGKLPDYDPELDEYNTLNRRYSPMGRWMSPDPGGLKVVHLDDPQTWNMYAYVRNNPATLTDPTGLAAPLSDQYGICQASSNPNCHPDDAWVKQSHEAQNQSQTKQLTADDVSKGIKAFDSDKGDKNPGRVVKALDTMGQNFTATGDAVRAGVKESGVEMPKDADKVLANVDSITRTGNNVVITNKDSMTIMVVGQIGKTISFTINESVKGKSGYQGPALQNLKGVGLGIGRLAKHPDHWGPE